MCVALTHRGGGQDDDSHELQRTTRGLAGELVDQLRGRRVYRRCPGSESTTKRFTCPDHSWTYDNTGRLVSLPGREGFGEVTLKSDGLTELPGTEFAGFLWVTLDPGTTPDLSDEFAAAGAHAVFDYAHAAVRDEDYPLVEGLQANLESGARDQLVFGRNEPGFSLATIKWVQALTLPATTQ